MFLMFSDYFDYFDVLMSKIILKYIKNIILIYFRMKNTFKNNRYYTSKYSYSRSKQLIFQYVQTLACKFLNID